MRNATRLNASTEGRTTSRRSSSTPAAATPGAIQSARRVEEGAPGGAAAVRDSGLLSAPAGRQTQAGAQRGAAVDAQLDHRAAGQTHGRAKRG